MTKTFFLMPRILQFLTVGGLAGCLIPLIQMLSGSVEIFGQAIGRDLLWKSGVGVILVPSALALGVSSIQFLLRAKNGRLVHIAGWVLMAIASCVGPRLLHIDVPMPVPTCVFIALLTLAISGYLYFSKEVARYFSGATV